MSPDFQAQGYVVGKKRTHAGARAHTIHRVEGVWRDIYKYSHSAGVNGGKSQTELVVSVGREGGRVFVQPVCLCVCLLWRPFRDKERTGEEGRRVIRVQSRSQPGA